MSILSPIEILRERYGYADFRGAQSQVVDTVIEGRDGVNPFFS